MPKAPHGYMPDPLGSAKFGVSKKVTVTAQASVIITAASSQVGVTVRVISFTNATSITFGDANLTLDGGVNPGAYILTAENQVIDLNISGAICAIVDGDEAVLAVQPLLADGYAYGRN